MFAHSYDPFGLQQPPLSPHSYTKHKRQESDKCRYRRTIEAQHRRQAELERLRLVEEKLNTDEVPLRRKSEARQWQLKGEEKGLRRPRRLDTIARGGTADHHDKDDTSYSNLLPPPYANISREDLEDEFSDTHPPGEIEVVLKPSGGLTSTSSTRPEKIHDTRRQHSDSFSTICTEEQQHNQESSSDEHEKQMRETSHPFQPDDDDDIYAAPPHAIAAEGLSEDEDDDGDEEDLDCIWRRHQVPLGQDEWLAFRLHERVE